SSPRSAAVTRSSTPSSSMVRLWPSSTSRCPAPPVSKSQPNSGAAHPIVVWSSSPVSVAPGICVVPWPPVLVGSSPRTPPWSSSPARSAESTRVAVTSTPILPPPPWSAVKALSPTARPRFFVPQPTAPVSPRSRVCSTCPRAPSATTCPTPSARSVRTTAWRRSVPPRTWAGCSCRMRRLGAAPCCAGYEKPGTSQETQYEHRGVVRVSTRRVLLEFPVDAADHGLGTESLGVGEDLGQPLVTEHVGVAAPFGDTVGHRKDHFPWADVVALGGETDVLESPEQRLGGAEGPHIPVDGESEGQRVSCRDQAYPHTDLGIGGRGHLPVQHGEESGGGVLLQDRHVETLHDVGGGEPFLGQRAQGGPGQTGDGGRLRAGAAHVTDGEAPAPACGEHVVEVTTDDVAFVGGSVEDRVVHTGDDRFLLLGWQQTVLQGLTHRCLLLVQTGVLHGRGHAATQVVGDVDVVTGELVGLVLADGHPTQFTSVCDQRDADGRATCQVVDELFVEPLTGQIGGRPQGLGFTLVRRWQDGEQRAQCLVVVLVAVHHVRQLRNPQVVGGVDGAPPAQAGSDELSGQSTGHPLVQGSGEQVAGLGQETQGSPPRQFHLGQACTFDGQCHQVGAFLQAFGGCGPEVAGTARSYPQQSGDAP